MSLDSADFIRIIGTNPNNESLYDVSDFYKDKSPKKIGNSLNRNINPKYNGNVLSYYPSGKKQATEKFIDGKLNGMCFYYYENEVLKEQILYSVENLKSTSKMIQKGDSLGNQFLDSNSSGKFKVSYKSGLEEEGEYINGLKHGLYKSNNPKLNEIYEDEYKDGVFIKGKTIEVNGKITTYDKLVKLAEFPGGIQGFSRFLSMSLRYPSEAKQKGESGRIYIAFVVQKDGALSDFKILRGVSPDLDEEALRVVKLSPKWLPGQERGKNVRVTYTIPIAFQLPR